MFVRAKVSDKGCERAVRVGDGFLSNPLITTNAAAGNQNITLAMMLGGVGIFTGAGGAVAYTFPATADILAAMPGMDIGDSYEFKIRNSAAQNATLTAGDASTTLAGLTVLNAATGTCILTKTAAATVSITTI